MLHRTAYVSAAPEELAAGELARIIGATRARNPQLGVSGALVYTGTHFLQVLEGPGTPVAALLERIRQDPRHHELVVLIDADCCERWYADCRIGYLYDGAGAGELAALHGRGLPLEATGQDSLRTLLAGADLW